MAVLLAGLAVAACQPAPQAHSETRDLATLKMHTMPAGTVGVEPGTPAGVAERIAVTGLQPDSDHPVFAGSLGCTSDNKRVYGTLKADANGSATGVVVVPPSIGTEGAPGGGIGLVIAVGPGSQEPAEAAPLACADADSNHPAQFTPAPAFSRARISVDMSYERAARILTVHVRATGLEPGTRHPNHIHTGQCESEGPVREVLHTLVADAQGNADVVTPIPQSDGIKAGAWYVAVHTGPRLESQAQYALLACGDVVDVSVVTP